MPRELKNTPGAVQARQLRATRKHELHELQSSARELREQNTRLKEENERLAEITNKRLAAHSSLINALLKDASTQREISRQLYAKHLEQEKKMDELQASLGQCISSTAFAETQGFFNV